MRKLSLASLFLTTCTLGVSFVACSSDDPATESKTTNATNTSANGTMSTATSAGTTGTTSSTTGTPTTTAAVTATATGTTTGTATTGATTTGAASTTTTGAATSTTGGDCATGQLFCGTGCVEIMSDPAHCGDCTTVCGEGISCVNGSCGDGGCGTLAGPIERSGSYVLEFGDLYFEVDAAGGKVVEFKRASGSNVFTTSAIHETNFGSTLWTAPQVDWEWPPVPEIDSEPYTVTVDETGASITMVSNGAPSVGPNVTVTKVFTANLCEAAIDISYSVANSGSAAASFAAWEVTRVVPGGLSFWGAQEGFLSDSVLPAEFEADSYWFDHVVDSTGDRKLFSEGVGGYIAFTQGTDLFVKSFSDVPATGHPPDHGEVEVYEDAADGYVELEVVGSYGQIAAGSAATLQMRWYLRPMPEGATRAVGDAALKAAVLDLIAP